MPKKIKEAPVNIEVKRALAEIWQYEFDRADRSKGPYKEAYKAAIVRGAKNSGTSHED